MPEMYFTVRWPDGLPQRCYSPSLVVADHLSPGRSYPLQDFVALSRKALETGSERVRARYGFGCASARLQIQEIEARAAGFEETAAAEVVVEGFER